MPKHKVMDRNKLVPEDVEEMWVDGADTKEIADVLHLWERDVYNWLARRRGRGVVRTFYGKSWAD